MAKIEVLGKNGAVLQPGVEADKISLTETGSTVKVSIDKAAIQGVQKIDNDLVILKTDGSTPVTIENFFNQSGEQTKIVVEDVDGQLYEGVYDTNNFTGIDFQPQGTDDSSTAMWLVPLIALGAVGAALAFKDDKDDDNGFVPPPKPGPEPVPGPEPESKPVDWTPYDEAVAAKVAAEAELAGAKEALDEALAARDELAKAEDYKDAFAPGGNKAPTQEYIDRLMAATKAINDQIIAANQKLAEAKKAADEANHKIDEVNAWLKTLPENTEGLADHSAIAAISKSNTNINPIDQGIKVDVGSADVTVLDVLKDLGALLLSIPKAIGAFAVGSFKDLIKAASDTGYGFKSSFDAIVSFLPSLGSSIMKIFSVVKDGLATGWDAIVKGIPGVFYVAKDALLNLPILFKGIMGNGLNVVKNAQDALKQIIETLKPLFANKEGNDDANSHLDASLMHLMKSFGGMLAAPTVAAGKDAFKEFIEFLFDKPNADGTPGDHGFLSSISLDGITGLLKGMLTFIAGKEAAVGYVDSFKQSLTDLVTAFKAKDSNFAKLLGDFEEAAGLLTAIKNIVPGLNIFFIKWGEVFKGTLPDALKIVLDAVGKLGVDKLTALFDLGTVKASLHDIKDLAGLKSAIEKAVAEQKAFEDKSAHDDAMFAKGGLVSDQAEGFVTLNKIPEVKIPEVKEPANNDSVAKEVIGVHDNAYGEHINSVIDNPLDQLVSNG